MSGPKGHGYRVISEAELRRREDEARSGRCQQRALRLAGLVAQLHHFGVTAPKAVTEPGAKTHDSLITWEGNLESAILDVENRVRAASAEAILRRLNATNSAVDVTAVSLGVRPTPTSPTSNQQPRSSELARVASEVESVVELIANLRDEPQKGELTAMAERVLQTKSAAQARGDLLSLKTKAANALQAQEYRGHAEQSVLEVAHIDTPEADAVRARAARVTSAADLTAVKKTVAEITDAATKAADAEFVEAALEEVLRELGFDLGEGFELADLGRSVAVANHADHPGYGVRVQLNPANGMIYTRVVAERTSSPEDDARAEDETCAKVHALAEGLQRHGVAAELKSERQPGEVPVERLSATVTGTRRKRTRSRVAQQRRAR